MGRRVAATRIIRTYLLDHAMFLEQTRQGASNVVSSTGGDPGSAQKQWTRCQLSSDTGGIDLSLTGKLPADQPGGVRLSFQCRGAEYLGSEISPGRARSIHLS